MCSANTDVQHFKIQKQEEREEEEKEGEEEDDGDVASWSLT